MSKQYAKCVAYSDVDYRMCDMSQYAEYLLMLMEPYSKMYTIITSFLITNTYLLNIVY